MLATNGSDYNTSRAVARIGSGASPHKKGTKNLEDSSFLIIVFLCYEKNDP